MSPLHRSRLGAARRVATASTIRTIAAATMAYPRTVWASNPPETAVFPIVPLSSDLSTALKAPYAASPTCTMIASEMSEAQMRNALFKLLLLFLGRVNRAGEGGYRRDALQNPYVGEGNFLRDG